MSINIRSCYKINSIVILSRTKWINKSKKDIQEILIRYFSSILVYFHLVKQDCRIWFLIFNSGELSEIHFMNSLIWLEFILTSSGNRKILWPPGIEFNWYVLFMDYWLANQDIVNQPHIFVLHWWKKSAMFAKHPWYKSRFSESIKKSVD